MRSIVLDSGAFIAAERYDKNLTALMKAAAKNNVSIFVPALVVAEIWRDPPVPNSAKTLGTATIIELEVVRAQKVGRLLGASATTQLTDAAVAIVAIERAPSLVLSSDVADIVRLVRAAGASCNVASADVLVQLI